MTSWEQLCEDPSLRDLPYKIEQDKWGRIVMSPHKLYHSEFQANIAQLLGRLLPGWTVMVECAVETNEGVRVPDVVAITRARHLPHRRAASLPVAPEICIEVASWSNTDAELAEKRALVAARGCVEFWTCSADGDVTFYQAVSGTRLEKSALCPDFPASIQLD